MGERNKKGGLVGRLFLDSTFELLSIGARIAFQCWPIVWFRSPVFRTGSGAIIRIVGIVAAATSPATTKARSRLLDWLVVVQRSQMGFDLVELGGGHDILLAVGKHSHDIFLFRLHPIFRRRMCRKEFGNLAWRFLGLEFFKEADCRR